MKISIKNKKKIKQEFFVSFSLIFCINFPSVGKIFLFSIKKDEIKNDVK
jgi:hypothetical protein